MCSGRVHNQRWTRPRPLCGWPDATGEGLSATPTTSEPLGILLFLLPTEDAASGPKLNESGVHVPWPDTLPTARCRWLDLPRAARSGAGTAQKPRRSIASSLHHSVHRRQLPASGYTR